MHAATHAPIVAIVPAGGTGSRALGTIPKQYGQLQGQPMLRRTVRALLTDARIGQVRVAVAPADAARAQAALTDLPRTVWRPCGGATRARTVLAALQDAALADDAWVLVHDAARPGLPLDALARLIDTCLAYGRGGLLALPVRDTVKRAQPGAVPACVDETVAREALWLAQTPQLFPAGCLQRALQEALDAGVEPGDEASAMERLDDAPLLVAGSPRNIKVTWAEDFAWMETWMS